MTISRDTEKQNIFLEDIMSRKNESQTEQHVLNLHLNQGVPDSPAASVQHPLGGGSDHLTRPCRD
jgi:hypothetical protein